MSRVNPLYLIAIVIIFILFTLKSGMDIDAKIRSTTLSYYELKDVAIELSTKQKIYREKKRVMKTLRRIINNSALRESKLIEFKKSDRVILSSKSMSLKGLNVIMKKLLNESYNIDSLKIDKISPRRVAFRVEIKW